MFKPKADRPQWQAIYDRLAHMSIGDVVTDEQLAALLPDAPEGSVRSAYARAVREIEDNDKRTFARVRKVGYRMVEAAEHEGLARRQHRSAKRRIASAGRKVRSADRSQLTPEQRRRFDAMEVHIKAQADMTRRLEARMERVEAAVKNTRREAKTDVAELSGRLDRLTELLTRHGIDQTAEPTSAA